MKIPERIKFVVSGKRIVVFENGKWLYNDNKEYKYDDKDFSDWKPLDLN